MTDQPEYTTTDHLTADEALYVLAGCKTVHLPSLRVAVITGTHTPAATEPAWPYTPGQILLATFDDDAPGVIAGHHLDQWHTSAVHYQHNVAQAMALATLVTGGAERGMWQYDGNVWYRPPHQAEVHRVWCGRPSPFCAFVGDTTPDNTYGRGLS